MLIEFRIQLDDNGDARVVQAQASPNPNFPSRQVLHAAYVPPGPMERAQLGGSEPLNDTGTGLPKGRSPQATAMRPSPMQASPGMTFVIGPIVINGSVPAQNYATPHPAPFEMPQADAQHAEPLMHDKPRAAKAAKRKAPARKR